MLSAIAARKAAQAAKLANTSQPPPSSPKDNSRSEEQTESDTERQVKSVLRPQNSKRKSPELTSSERRVVRKTKRRKKDAKAQITQTRYYEPRNDVVGQEETSSSSSSDDNEDIQEVRFADTELQEIIQPQRAQKLKRTWSPSAPHPETSNDDLGFPAPCRSPRSERSRDAGYPTALSMSFVPQLNKNVFRVEDLGTNSLSGRKATVVALKQNETVALLGVYSLTVLRGAVSLMGTELHASGSKSHTVFAPKCSPIPILKAIASTGYPSCALPDWIASAVSQESAVLFLEDVYTGVEGLGRVCKIFENMFEASSICDSILDLSGAKLLSSTTLSLQHFQLPSSWKRAFSSLPAGNDEEYLRNLDPLVLLVKGQKRSGKSTFARSLVNRLVRRYRRVAYLECDIGQTEFTPPGLVSLHILDQPIFGPPFTHPRLPYASHFIGATSPRNNPGHYLASVSALLQTFKLEVQYPAPGDELQDPEFEDSRIVDVVPLVVNTMGWLKGLGADLARQIEEMVVPTHIFSTRPSSTGFDEALPTERTGSALRASDQNGTASRIVELDAFPANSQSTHYSAADWRTLSLMSYFHSIPSQAQYKFVPPQFQPSSPTPYDPHAPLCTWDCRLPLIAQVPYAVSPSEAIDNVILVAAGMEDVVPSEIGRVLNGAIVALVPTESDIVEPSLHNTANSRLPYTQGSPPPDPSTSNCIGLAIIRGVSPSLFDAPLQEHQINAKRDLLHVLTPLPPGLIASAGARCLVKGEIELPVWGMLDYRELERGGPRAPEMPYLQWSKSDAIGAERRRVRRNIMRKGQV